MSVQAITKQLWRNSTAALPPHSAVSLRLTVARSLYENAASYENAARLSLAANLMKRLNGKAKPYRTVLRQSRKNQSRCRLQSQHRLQPADQQLALVDHLWRQTVV